METYLFKMRQEAEDPELLEKVAESQQKEGVAESQEKEEPADSSC